MHDSRRFSPAELRNTKTKLPKVLEPLREWRNLTLVQITVARRKRWHAEISCKEALRIQAQLKESEELRRAHDQILLASAADREICDRLRRDNEMLSRVNAQILKNDKTPAPDAERSARGSKHVLVKAQETAYKYSGLPMQGGAPGLRKRR